VKKPKARANGTGSVYKRAESVIWQMAYQVNGRVVRESTGKTNKKKAEDVLRQRLAEVQLGKYLGPAAERVVVSELAEDTLKDYEVQGNRDIVNPKIRWEKHLKLFFGNLKGIEVTRPLIDRYVAARLQAGASNASINRELAFLKRCFRLGLEHEKVYRVPTFPHLAEDNVREGFPTDEQYTKLKVACSKEGLWLRAMLELAATFGWRKSSLLAMRVQNVDLMNGTIRQEGSTTKSGEGNEVKMTPDLKLLITACISGKEPDDFLFTRVPKRQLRRPVDQQGQRPVEDFRSAWARATKAAGVPELHFHDLCRKAARDLDSAGISQLVGMQVMGRKTESIYKRYRIVDRRDVDRAIDRLVEHKAELSQDQRNAQFNAQLPVGSA
jgi:integrase